MILIFLILLFLTCFGIPIINTFFHFPVWNYKSYKIFKLLTENIDKLKPHYYHGDTSYHFLLEHESNLYQISFYNNDVIYKSGISVVNVMNDKTYYDFHTRKTCVSYPMIKKLRKKLKNNKPINNASKGLIFYYKQIDSFRIINKRKEKIESLKN